MPITNPVGANDVVFIQRDNINSAYGEIHVSGTLLIPYIDASGHITVADSGSFFTIFPVTGSGGGPGGGTIIVTASLVPITSSWAESASWAPLTPSDAAISASWATASYTASYLSTGTYQITASRAVSASYVSTVISSSWASSSLLSISASWASSSYTASFLSLGTYQITASRAISASYALSASQVISASWSSFSISASYLYGSHTGSTLGTSSWAISSSWTEIALSSSYAKTASYLNPGANIYLSQSYISSVTGSTSPPFQPATIFWDDNAKTYAIYTDDPGSSLQLGQEQWIRSYAGEYIPNGSPVYVSSSLNNLPIVKLGLAAGITGGIKSGIVGIATNNIPSGSIGLITTLGQVHDLNTSLFVDGQAIYLSHINSGSIVSSPPPKPFEIVRIGYVIKSDGASGIIQIDITNTEQNTYQFVGMHIQPTITTGSAGLVFVGTGSVNLSETISGFGPVKNYQVPSASFTISTASIDCQYLVATYNSGSPVYQLLTTDTAIDEIQTTLVDILIYRVTEDAVSVISYDEPGNLLANKLLHRMIDVNGIERATGLEIGVTGSLYCTLSSGSVWVGSNFKNLPSLNSTSSRMTLLAHSASIISTSISNQLTNTLCDDGTNVVALGSGANHWVANYVYRGVGNLNTMMVMYSEDFSGVDGLIDAQLGQPPAVPEELTDTALLVGRVIYQKGVAIPAKIESAFVKSFTPAGITNHNELGGLQGGTAGEFYHLSSASYAQVLSETSSWANSASYATSASWAPGGSGTSIITGSLVPITSSWAISASWSPSSTPGTVIVTGSTYQITSSWANFVITSSYANSALSASWAPGGSSGTTIITGSLVPITSSWAISASWYPSISSISASWASSSISASYALSASWSPDVDINLVTGSLVPITSSWAISASWAPGGSSGTTIVTSSLVPITSSWAVSASWAPSTPSSIAISASWASSSISASYALTASYFTAYSGSNLLYLKASDGFTYPITLTNDNSLITFTIGQTPVTGSNGFINIGTIIDSSAIRTISSNYTITTYDYTIIVTGSNAITVNLPSASLSLGRVFIIKNRNNNPLYINPNDGDIIDGAKNLTCSFQNTAVQLQCSGSEWFIL